MESHKAEVNPPPPLSSDALRLLYAIALYTDTAERSWLKEFTISVIAHLGVKRGVFTQYSLAPSLFSFRGVKMYAIVSQHALGDLDVFFRAGLVERILLNTRFYSQISALRLAPQGHELIGQDDTLTEKDRRAVEALIRCDVCGKLIDFAVSREESPHVRLIMNKVCSCRTAGVHRGADFWRGRRSHAAERIASFFSIGDVDYAGKPFFLGRHHGD